jgi:hypothetical protein
MKDHSETTTGEKIEPHQIPMWLRKRVTAAINARGPRSRPWGVYAPDSKLRYLIGLHGSDTWLDHWGFIRGDHHGDIDQFISEPYQVLADDLASILAFCEATGTTPAFTGGAVHNPGCLRVIISQPKES